MTMRVVSLLPFATDTVVSLGVSSWLVARSHEVGTCADTVQAVSNWLSKTEINFFPCVNGMSSAIINMWQTSQ